MLMIAPVRSLRFGSMLDSMGIAPQLGYGCSSLFGIHSRQLLFDAVHNNVSL
jgi:hypothetical protein